MHNNLQNEFPVHPYLEVLKGRTTYRSTYKWIAIVVVSHPDFGPQCKLYEWIWKNDHWSTQSKVILNDRQYNNISLEGMEEIRKEFCEEFSL